MLEFITKRVLLIIPILLGISFIIFGIMSMTPGSPAMLILGDNAPESAINELNESLGFNRPFIVRYFDYVGDAVRGDFGNSYRTGRPVVSEILPKFFITLRIAVFGIIVSLLIGIPIGILSAVRQYSRMDIAATVTAMVMASIPGFWLGLMLILLFALKLGWFPSNGTGSWKHLVLPVFTLSLPVAANLMRLTRTTMLETIRQDYIRMARAKGASENAVIWSHALKNALLPVVTVLGLNFGGLLGGAIIAEQVFGINGLGTLTITSIRSKDIPQVMGTVLFFATTFMFIMLAVDILYTFIDPRVKSRFISVKKRKGIVS
jgi:peptide/nickel transport system permease protein